jgi:hypothetical protein
MKAEKKKNILWILDEIACDAERDVNEAEGTPCTAHNIAVFNGKQNAMIKTLAEIVKEVLLDQT